MLLLFRFKLLHCTSVTGTSIRCKCTCTGQESSGNLSLAHADIQTAVRTRYLKTSAGVEMEMFLHCLMAGYLYSLADPHRDGSWAGKSARAFQELPYHLVSSP